MSPGESLSWRGGGCHCKAVRFEVGLGHEVRAQECNCSICSMTGFIHIIVPKSRLRILAGEEALAAYSFNTMTARHLFCRVCGVKSFYQPRSNPDGWSVNARCLDDAADLAIEIESFDGAHFEANAGALAELSREASA